MRLCANINVCRSIMRAGGEVAFVIGIIAESVVLRTKVCIVTQAYVCARVSHSDRVLKALIHWECFTNYCHRDVTILSTLLADLQSTLQHWLRVLTLL